VRRMERKAALAVVAAAVIVTGLQVVPASADPGDTIAGRCFVASDSNATLTQSQNQGVIAVAAEMLTSAHNPDVNAEVDCRIQVDTVVGPEIAPGTELDVGANTAGLVEGQQQIIWDDQGGTLPSELCEDDIWGDGDRTGWVCQPFTPLQTPPQAVDGLIGTVLDEINVLFATVICPTLKQLGLGGCT
jgi:hypothetical protein